MQIRSLEQEKEEIPWEEKKNKINKVKRSAILPQHDSTTQEAAAWEFSKINKNPPKFK